MGQGDGIHHALLAGLVRAALDHGDSGVRARHHDLQAGRRPLLVGGVDHQLAIHFGNANGTYRPVERDVRDHHGRGGGHHRDHIGRVHLIGGDHRGHDLNVALERLAEQRSQRPVDKPRHQDLAILGPPLAFEDRSRYLAGRVSLLVVLHLERYVVQPLDGVFRTTYRGKHGRSAVLCVDGAIRLTRQASGLENQFLAAHSAAYSL